MIKERAMELVTALRSGKYKQGRNFLRKDDKFCCLGVACDISGQGVWHPKFDDVDHCYFYMDKASALPKAVQNYFGFNHSEGGLSNAAFGDGMIIGGERFEWLSAANDCGKTFDEIADYIEQNWEYL